MRARLLHQVNLECPHGRLRSSYRSSVDVGSVPALTPFSSFVQLLSLDVSPVHPLCRLSVLWLFLLIILILSNLNFPLFFENQSSCSSPFFGPQTVRWVGFFFPLSSLSASFLLLLLPPSPSLTVCLLLSLKQLQGTHSLVHCTSTLVAASPPSP